MDFSQLDTYLRIQASADKLSAFLTFTRITDEFSCSAFDMEQYIRSKGVVHGLRTQVIEQICKDPISFSKEQTVIAQGDNPPAGKDGYVRFAFSMGNEDHQPSEDEGGKVDLKQVTKLNNVLRGQLIAELIEPLSGPAGMTVTGEELAPKLGKRARFKIGKNVVVNESAMYAAIDGLVTQTEKGKINVFPVYEVNGDVDYSVGNIDFVGTVVIRGNVLNGFRVKASGDIRVVGGVEGAELESEGSIEITSGIMAGNKGHVRAGRNIKSSFIQDGNVVAGEDIIVSQSIMHSTVKAGKNVICSGAKGLIVGGIVQAGEQVSVRTLGNVMSTATVVEVGVNPQLREELLQLRSTIKQSYESNEKTEKALVLLDQLAAAGQLSAERLEMRAKLNATKRQTIALIEQSKSRMLEIERTLEDTDRSKVNVSGTVYSGTKVVIGRYTKFVKDSAQRVSFKLMDGDISLTPYHA
ncbi:FapA family protein [Paenibacillus sp. PL2-23]|uniref:DUF342 domain-containing protein n=1 Tax=Paenibacillus sp. PL2-23 TaxID=2100729 RepID=UPI0030F50A08